MNLETRLQRLEARQPCGPSYREWLAWLATDPQKPMFLGPHAFVNLTNAELSDLLERIKSKLGMAQNEH
jgi:hypothetical protein